MKNLFFLINVLAIGLFRKHISFVSWNRITFYLFSCTFILSFSFYILIYFNFYFFVSYNELWQSVMLLIGKGSIVKIISKGSNQNSYTVQANNSINRKIVFVYTQEGNSLEFPSQTECKKTLGISRKTISKAILKAQLYKNYFFSVTTLEPELLQNLGFSRSSLNNCTTLIPFGSYLTSSVGFNKFYKSISKIITLPPHSITYGD